MCDDLENARRGFLIELDASIRSHDWRKRFDAFLQQALVILSAVAGFLSLAIGVFAKERPELSVYAGIVGALTSVFAILLQQLHCVRAVLWHERMSVELGAIRGKYLYEFLAKPNAEQLAALNRECETLRTTMADVWERATVTSTASSGQTGKKKRPDE